MVLLLLLDPWLVNDCVADSFKDQLTSSAGFNADSS